MLASPLPSPSEGLPRRGDVAADGRERALREGAKRESALMDRGCGRLFLVMEREGAVD